MGQSNVGIRLTMDAGQFKSEANDLSNSIDGIRERIKELQNAGKWQESSQLLLGLNNAVSARGQIMAQSRQAEQLQNRQSPFQNNPVNQMLGGQLGWMFQQMATQLVHGILSSFDTALSAAKMRASGDYTGAAVAYEKGMGGLPGAALARG